VGFDESVPTWIRVIQLTLLGGGALLFVLGLRLPARLWALVRPKPESGRAAAPAARRAQRARERARAAPREASPAPREASPALTGAEPEPEAEVEPEEEDHAGALDRFRSLQARLKAAEADRLERNLSPARRLAELRDHVTNELEGLQTVLLEVADRAHEAEEDAARSRQTQAIALRKLERAPGDDAAAPGEGAPPRPTPPEGDAPGGSTTAVVDADGAAPPDAPDVAAPASEEAARPAPAPAPAPRRPAPVAAARAAGPLLERIEVLRESLEAGRPLAAVQPAVDDVVAELTDLLELTYFLRHAAPALRNGTLEPEADERWEDLVARLRRDDDDPRPEDQTP